LIAAVSLETPLDMSLHSVAKGGRGNVIHLCSVLDGHFLVLVDSLNSKEDLALLGLRRHFIGGGVVAIALGGCGVVGKVIHSMG
jgi:hypothetical protein